MQLGQDPVERAHGQQVADVLVGDGAEADVGVPQRYGLADVAAGIEVEVGLGVVGDHAGLGGQHRDEGDDGQAQIVDPCPQRTGRPESGHQGAMAAGTPVGRCIRGEFGCGHEWSVV